MMKLALGAAALMGFVSAAELPQFSAADDYDELNLNIRLLSTNATGNGSANATTYTTTTVVKATVGHPTATTSADLMADAPLKTALVGGFASATGTESSATTISGMADARRLSTEKRRLADVTTKITFVTVLTSLAAAQQLQSDVAAGSGFDAAFTSSMTTALASLTGYSVSGVASEGASVADASGTTVAAPTPAPAPAASPAAPAAKKDASSASMLGANAALVAAAALASLVF